MSLIAELRRRSVFKVGAAYLVVAWLVVQAASIGFPAFDAPPWALRVFIFVVLLGFPVVLMVAWVLQVTPEGVKVETASIGNKRFFAAAAVLAALAVAWFYLGQPATRGADNEAAAHTIAVLPFVNMSGDAGNEYFSDGISEEILNSLAQMPGLRVAARTSSFSFKGHQKEIPDIARELEVRMVLEGSVRKQGERVRITAQLIDAQQGFHLWSKTYDRELKDIFAIQDEIAYAIASELKVKLGADHTARTARPDTTDLEAYDLYLKGISLWQARGAGNIREADRLFRAAVARDPNFAKAWAGLALTYVLIPEWTADPLGPSWLIARDAAEHAISLDPNLPEPYAALGYIALSEFRFATGRVLFTRAHELAPSFATGYQWHGEGLLYEGARHEALELTRKATELDRKSSIVQQAYANQLWQLGRDDEAAAICDAVLERDPGFYYCLLIRYEVAFLRKDYVAARKYLREMAQPRGAEAVSFADAMIDVLEGKRDSQEIAARLADLPDGSLDPQGLSPLAHGDAVLWLISTGHLPLALRRVDAWKQWLPHWVRGIMFDPHFAALHCLPEFNALARQFKVDDAHVAAMCKQAGG